MFLRLLFTCLISACHAKSALEEFVSRRHVRNHTITLLSATSSFIWVEYTYELQRPSRREKLLDINSTGVLRVGVFENSDALFDCRLESDSSTNYRAGGYSLEMLKLAEDLLHFRTEYVYLYGTHNGTVVQDKRVDVVLCHANLLNFPGDFRQLLPTLKSRFVLVYKLSSIDFEKDIFILTFAGSLWLVFFALLVLLALCLRVSTKHYYIIYPKYGMWTWVEITLWAIAAACQQGLSYDPYKFASCLIFLLGNVTAYLLYTGFTAGITSTLLQQDFHQLKVKDLEKMNIQFTTLNYVTDLDDLQPFKNSFKVNNLDEMFAQLEDKNTVGVAPKIMVDQYITTKHGGCYATTLLQHTYYRSFLVRNDKRLETILNACILKIQELGIAQHILQRNLQPIPVNFTSSYSNASFEHVASAIFLFLAGVLASIVVLIMEFIFAYYKNHIHHF